MENCMDKIEMPIEARKIINAVTERIRSDDIFIRIIALLKNYTSYEQFGELEFLTRELAAKYSVHEYSMLLSVLCAALPMLRQRYAAAGIGEQIFYDTFHDFTYKAKECKRIYGIWGNATGNWNHCFLTANRVALGRLQFERHGGFSEDQFFNGRKINPKKDLLIAIHIPSSGPLYPEAVTASLDRACAFYQTENFEYSYFICESWMLYPGYESLFDENSNIRSFAQRFNIIHVEQQERFRDAWRIFNRDVKTGDIEETDNLPQDTALQRAFAAYMKNNGKFGIGFGAISCGKLV